MKIILIILISMLGLACSIDEALLIKTKINDVNQFDLSLKQDNFLEVDDKDEGLYRKLNFFRLDLLAEDSYEEYSFKIDEKQYKKIYACIRMRDWKEKKNFLKSLFSGYKIEIKKLTNIILKVRRVIMYSSYGLSAPASECFILTGALNDIEESKDGAVKK